MIDVEGMIRQASIRVSVDQLVQNGKRHIHLLSREKVDQLINRSVRTILDKHRVAAAHRDADSAARLAADSRAEFEALLEQYQQTSEAGRAVEQSRETLAEEFEVARFAIEPGTPKGEDRPCGGGPFAVESERPAAPPADEREIAFLQKRIAKLQAHVATMEAALKTLSTARTFSNQQVQNLLRDLGLAPEDRHFEKKKEMLKVLLTANQGIRRKARELAARGITLEAPEEKADFSLEADSRSGVLSRSSA